MRHYLKTLLMCGLWLCVATTSFSQTTFTVSSADGRTPPAIAPGTPAGSYALTGFESVNLFNGKVNAAIPLLQIGARGEAAYTMTAVVDRMWDVSTTEVCDPACYLATVISDSGEAFFPGLSPGRMWARYSAHDVVSCNDGTTSFFAAFDTLTRLTFVGPNGTETDFVDVATYGEPRHADPLSNCLVPRRNRGRNFIATDGSMTRFTSDQDIIDIDANGEYAVSGTVQFANGMTYTIVDGSVTKIRDRNGNLLTLTYENSRVRTVVDSIGRGISVQYASNTTTVQELGTGRSFTLTYDTLDHLLRPGYSMQTPEQLFPTLYSAPLSPITLYREPFLASIQYPNGQTMTFKYNSYGEVARIKLPTGGAFEYDWQNVGTGVVQLPGDPGFPSYMVYRRVIERRVYNAGDVLEQVQLYPMPIESCSEVVQYYPQQCTTTVTVSYTDPTYTAASGTETHTFFGAPSYVYGPCCAPPVPQYVKWMSFYTPWKTGREYNTAFDGLRTEQRQWQQRSCTGDPCWYPDANADTAPAHDARAVQTLTTLGSVTSSEVYCFDNYNNRTHVYEYDYGFTAGMVGYCQPPGGYSRHTVTTYKTNSAYTAPGINLVRLPEITQVHGPAGLWAQTTMSYDDYVELPLSDYGSNPTQHEVSFTTAYTTRGNVTKISRWLNTNGSTLTTKTRYDILGNVTGQTDAKGNSTAYAFNGSCAYGFPNTITNALNQQSTLQYDCNLGKPTLITDANSVSTRYTYETSASELGRLKQIDRAYQKPEEATTTFTYNDTPGAVSVASSLSILAENPPAMCTTNGPIVSTTIYDGLGRESVSAFNIATGKILTARQYDERGRIAKVSNPYAVDTNGNVMPGESATQYMVTSYDRLSRIVQVTMPDGSMSTTNYLNNTATTTDPLGKARKTTTDALGRLVGVIEDPLGTPPIPTGYAYDPLDNLTGVCQNGTISAGSCIGGAAAHVFLRFPEPADQRVQPGKQHDELHLL